LISMLQPSSDHLRVLSYLNLFARDKRMGHCCLLFTKKSVVSILEKRIVLFAK
jgi:hypothetical protein